MFGADTVSLFFKITRGKVTAFDLNVYSSRLPLINVSHTQKHFSVIIDILYQQNFLHKFTVNCNVNVDFKCIILTIISGGTNI